MTGIIATVVFVALAVIAFTSTFAELRLEEKREPRADDELRLHVVDRDGVPWLEPDE